MLLARYFGLWWIDQLPLFISHSRLSPIYLQIESRLPSAFDLSAIQTTAKLVQLLKKPAVVVFTAGNPNAPRVYGEAGELVEGFGTPPCPIQIPDRAAYRHASGEGRTVMEYEPAGKAADDIRQIYLWTCRQVGLPIPRKSTLKKAAA